MDMRETSAMTEASGLIDDQEGTALAPGERTGEAAENSRSLRSPSSDAAIRWADQLRSITVKAPLQSLLVAFLLGLWVARRR
ncbi:hypothetical protein AC629_19265 [Bradyrhizobium sp. NAS80.1]|uniref:hypothetical protein n=1 Tax=Bradyrhizobium sp. NAS80.1 TaxID=1680159 RepID=UPI00095F3A65|nr:hypothetical protein [Bradyrhizobium sp. NAS80.1]OKO85361.1 hypothetical protein AC629_19265 [Bradyrhizobium sp. NAS80.1]